MLLKIILLEMANQAGDITIVKDSTRDLDSETADKIAKKTGLTSRVPAYIDRHLVRMMSIFCDCTASLRAYHQYRASIAQDIDKSHDHHIKWACGAAGRRAGTGVVAAGGVVFSSAAAGCILLSSSASMVLVRLRGSMAIGERAVGGLRL